MGRIISPSLEHMSRHKSIMTVNEKLIFDLFEKNLDAEWEIYFKPHMNGIRPCFVLLNPNAGIAIYEIVEWELNKKIFNWDMIASGKYNLSEKYENGKFLRAPDPFKKIFYYKEQIIKLYAPSLLDGANEGGAFKVVTAGLIFPNASREDINDFFEPVYRNSAQGKYSKNNPVISKEDIESNDVTQIFPESVRKVSPCMTDSVVRELRSWFSEPEHTKSQREPLILDVRQKHLVMNRTKTGFQRVRGPAGSGKTHVLAAKAAKLASEGKRVLVVSFNITLINFIQDMILRAGQNNNDLLHQVDLYSFHAWCKWVCIEYGYKHEYDRLWGRDENEDEIAISEGLAHLTHNIIKEHNLHGTDKGICYDAVLVDEGQDFHLSWWQVLISACRDGGEKILVADMTQDLYETADVWTEDVMNGAGFKGPWSELKTAYRLPPQLVPLVRDYAENYLPDINVNLPEANILDKNVQVNLGSQVYLKWLQVTESDLISIAANEILNMPALTNPETVSYSDVVLLTDKSEVGWDIVKIIGSKGVKVAHTYDNDDERNRKNKKRFFMGKEKVKGTTFHSFKGWEARYLVVCVSRIDRKTDWAALYVALTRLKQTEFGASYLTVVCSVPSLSEYGSTWPKQ